MVESLEALIVWGIFVCSLESRVVAALAVPAWLVAVVQVGRARHCYTMAATSRWAACSLSSALWNKQHVTHVWSGNLPCLWYRPRQHPAPSGEMATPSAGMATPSAGMAVSSTGIAVSSAGMATPSAGMATPSTKWSSGLVWHWAESADRWS